MEWKIGYDESDCSWHKIGPDPIINDIGRNRADIILSFFLPTI